MSGTFTSYADRVRTASNKNMWLGMLVWYTVVEAAAIEHSTLEAFMTDGSIPEGLKTFVPPKPRDDNVFKQACTHVARKRIPNQDGTFSNLLVRDVSTMAGRVYKHIVVETVDGDNKRLSYTPSIEVAFNPDTSTIEFTDLIWRDDIASCARAAADEIRSGFLQRRGKVNAYTIREMFRKIIGASGATVVRPSGGVYFVQTGRLELVDICQQLSEHLPGTSFHLTPLLDDGQQREMLRAAFEAETKGAIEARLVEIDELIASGGVTTRKLGALTKEMWELGEKVDEYRALLSVKLDQSDLAFKALEHNMHRLLKHKK